MVGCNSGRASPSLRRNRPSAIPTTNPGGTPLIIRGKLFRQPEPALYLFRIKRIYATLQKCVRKRNLFAMGVDREAAALRRREARKFGGFKKGACGYCRPLKSHKTTKEMIGIPRRKKAEIWKGSTKKLGGGGRLAATGSE